MSKRSVVFLAATEYDNLGVGYIAATLNMAGIETRIVDFRKRKSYILNVIKTINPVLIGFSIIFLNYIDHFITLAQYLRKNGINCHFTAGGHYASLKYDELFRIIPQLDSVVRFEGEYTLLELVKYINSGEDWKGTPGLVYRINEEIVANPLRPVETDLDKFPYPCRLKPRDFGFKKRFLLLSYLHPIAFVALSKIRGFEDDVFWKKLSFFLFEIIHNVRIVHANDMA
jgi:radical SAM superfamily enzyme YgiQ (UPF0313 family)